MAASVSYCCVASHGDRSERRGPAPCRRSVHASASRMHPSLDPARSGIEQTSGATKSIDGGEAPCR